MPATTTVVGGDDNIISIPPSASAAASEDGEYYVSPLHKRNSTEMWAHALANITPTPTPSAPSTSTIFPTPSLSKQDSSMSASTMVCSCGICQDAIGNHNAETSCDTAARMLRIANRSFVGEAIKFITTVALAFLIGYYALKSQMSELKGQVSDLRTQVDAAETQFATANRDLTDQVSKARTDIQAQVAASTTGLDSRLSIYINILRAFPDAATINATIKRVNVLDTTLLSRQVNVIRKDAQILTHDTQILHSNITQWTSYLRQTESITNQHLNNVTSQYMNVSQQLQQALANTSQHYDHHLHSLHELSDNTTSTVRTAIDDATNHIHQVVSNALAQLEQSIDNIIVLRNISDNVTVLINHDTQRMSQLHTNLSLQLQQLFDASIATMSATWSQFNQTASISRTQLQQTFTTASSAFHAQAQKATAASSTLQAQLETTVTDAKNKLDERVKQAVIDAEKKLDEKAKQAVTTSESKMDEKVKHASEALTDKFSTTVDTRLKKHSLVAQRYGVAAVCSKLLDENTAGINIFTVPVVLDPSRTSTCANYCGQRKCIGAVAQTTDPEAADVISPPIYMQSKTNDPVTRVSSYSSVASNCHNPVMSLWSGSFSDSTGSVSHGWEPVCEYGATYSLYTIPDWFQPDTMIGKLEITYTFGSYCRFCHQVGLCDNQCYAHHFTSDLRIFAAGSNNVVYSWLQKHGERSTAEIQRTDDNFNDKFRPGQQIKLTISTTQNQDLSAACINDVKTNVKFIYQYKTQYVKHQRYCCCTEKA